MGKKEIPPFPGVKVLVQGVERGRTANSPAYRVDLDEIRGQLDDTLKSDLTKLASVDQHTERHRLVGELVSSTLKWGSPPAAVLVELRERMLGLGFDSETVTRQLSESVVADWISRCVHQSVLPKGQVDLITDLFNHFDQQLGPDESVATKAGLVTLSLDHHYGPDKVASTLHSEGRLCPEDMMEVVPYPSEQYVKIPKDGQTNSGPADTSLPASETASVYLYAIVDSDLLGPDEAGLFNMDNPASFVKWGRATDVPKREREYQEGGRRVTVPLLDDSPDLIGLSDGKMAVLEGEMLHLYHPYRCFVPLGTAHGSWEGLRGTLFTDDPESLRLFNTHLVQKANFVRELKLCYPDGKIPSLLILHMSSGRYGLADLDLRTGEVRLSLRQERDEQTRVFILMAMDRRDRRLSRLPQEEEGPASSGNVVVLLSDADSSGDDDSSDDDRPAGDVDGSGSGDDDSSDDDRPAGDDAQPPPVNRRPMLMSHHLVVCYQVIGTMRMIPLPHLPQLQPQESRNGVPK